MSNSQDLPAEFLGWLETTEKDHPLGPIQLLMEFQGNDAHGLMTG